MLNYTTTIKAEKTVGEIQGILSRYGATKIMLEYESGRVSIISFQIIYSDMPLSFRLPVNVRGLHKALSKKKIDNKYKKEDHAYNVAWRIQKVWLEAQLSLIEGDQADLATIMLPYCVTNNGSTVSENLLHSEKGKQLLLN